MHHAVGEMPPDALVDVARHVCRTCDVVPSTISHKFAGISAGLASCPSLRVSLGKPPGDSSMLLLGKLRRIGIEAVGSYLRLDLMHFHCRGICADNRGQIIKEALCDTAPAISVLKTPLKLTGPAWIPIPKHFAPCPALTLSNLREIVGGYLVG
jgi:hypothetical protein